MANIVGDVAISVGADIAPLVREMDKASGRVSKFGKDVESTSARMAKMAKQTAAAAAVVGGVVATIGGVAQKVSNVARELEKLSQISGVGVERFQSLAFAAKEYGIEQDKLSDILKDVNDKVGDYLQNGAGPLKDFFDNIAPKVGVTAEQFRRLSGPDALGLYVASLEKAGVSQAELTFYMEALANDATRLAPLFSNNAAALNELEQAARDMGVVIDEDLIAKASRMGEIWDRMMGAMQARFISFAATVMNGFDAIFGITEDAQREIGREKLMGLADERLKVIDDLRKAEARANAARAASPNPDTVPTSSDKAFLEAQLEAIEEEMNVVNDGIMKIEEQIRRREEAKARLEALANGESDAGGTGDSGGGGGGGSKSDADRKQAETRLELLRDQFASEMELLESQYLERQAILEDSLEKRLLTEQEYANLSLAAQEELNRGMAALEQQRRAASLSAIGGMFGDLSSLMSSQNKKIFGIGKAAAIAEATISGYQAATDAWAQGMKIGGPPAAAAFTAASLAKTGALISQIASTSIGGGSAGASGGGGGGAVAAPAANTSPRVALTLTGGNLFTKDQVRELINQINEAVEDGAIVRLT